MNVLQVIANAMYNGSRSFSSSTSLGDAFRRIAKEIEEKARKHPEFSQGLSVSQDLRNKMAGRS